LKLLSEVVNAVAVAAASASSAPSERFGRGGTSIAAAGNRLARGTRENTCHVLLDAEKPVLLPKFISCPQDFLLNLRFESKTSFSESNERISFESCEPWSYA
jgi:hypothetical protein